MTSEERMALRAEMGLDTSAVQLKVEQPKARVITTGEQLAESQKAQEEGPGYLASLPNAFKVDNTATSITNAGGFGSIYERHQFPLDTEFNPKEYAKENKERLMAMKGIDMEEALDNLGSSHSREEADAHLAVMEEVFGIEQELAEAGGAGLAARLTAAVLDPTDIAIASITGTAGAAVKMGRMGKILTAGLSAGAAAGGTEAVLASDNPFRDQYDVGFATLAGFTMGSGLGALLSKSDFDKLRKLSNDEANKLLDDAADSVGAQRVAHEAEGPDTRIDADSETNLEELVAKLDDPDFDGANVVARGLQKLSFSIGNRLRNSKIDEVRKLAGAMFEGGLVKGVRGFTAELRANQLNRVFMAGITRESSAAFKAWSKRNGFSGMRRASTTEPAERFYSEVGRALKGADDVSSEAVQAAKAIRKHINEIHSRAQKAGVKGFEREALEDYFPRMLNHSKFEATRMKFGDQALGKWYREAIISKMGSDITEEVAQRIADAYVHVMRKKGLGLEEDLLHGIRIDDIAHLRKVFKDYDDLNELINAVESMKVKETAERGTVSHGKRRIQMDEQYDGFIVAKDGTRQQLKFHEMYENNALKVLGRYGRTMSGHIGMAEQLGIKSRDEFDELMLGVASKAEGRLTPKEMETLNRDMKDGYDLMLGLNRVDANPHGDLSMFARTLQGINHILYGTQFGIAALAEMGNVIAKAGVVSFMRSIPEWRALVRRAADGTLDHDLARTLEMLYAPGTFTLSGLPIRNMDELGETLTGGSVVGDAATALDAPLKSGMRITNLVSGLTGVTDFTQRLASVEMMRLLSRAANGKKLRKGQQARLDGLGLDAEMRERIFNLLRKSEGDDGLTRTVDDGLEGQINMHKDLVAKMREEVQLRKDEGRAFKTAEKQLGVEERRLAKMEKKLADRPAPEIRGGAGKYKGKRLVDIDLDRANAIDKEAVEALSLGMNREVRQAIQETDATGLPRIFHSPAGKLMFQFMSFPWQAIEKQSARMAHYADLEAGKTIAATMFITSTAYIAQTSIEFANNPEERAKRLTPENIAKVAFMRSGFASMLPAMYDTAAPLVGLDREFTMGRQSGLNTGLLTPWESNASAATLKNLYKTVGNVTGAVLSPEEQITDSDIKGMGKMVPFQRLLGFKNVIEWVSQQFPENREES
jgi:hypothetical protein